MRKFITCKINYCLLSMITSLLFFSTASIADSVDDYVLCKMKKLNIPGVSVAIVKNGQIVKSKGYGFSNIELKSPAIAETIYQSGSIGKQFTAMLTMILVEKGMLRLDDKINQYIIDAPDTWKNITIFLAGFIQLIFQLIALYRMGFLVKPKMFWKDEGGRRVLKLIVPALFGASMGQISILINTILASFLATGSITWLYYSERLAYFPLGIFGVALATVILPHLSRQHAQESKEGFSSALDWGLR